MHRFAHTINVDFFTDLVEVFNNLIANDQLDYRQCLYAIQVVLIMLSGQGEALNIDPIHFYSHLYKVLFHITAGMPYFAFFLFSKFLNTSLSKT